MLACSVGGAKRTQACCRNGHLSLRSSAPPVAMGLVLRREHIGRTLYSRGR